MKKICFILLCLVLCPPARAASTDMQIQMIDAEISRLQTERDQKMQKLHSCAKSVNGFKIAGITTLALTGVGIGVNIVQYNKIKGLDHDIEMKKQQIEQAKKDRENASKIQKLQSDLNDKEREKQTITQEAAAEKARIQKLSGLFDTLADCEENKQNDDQCERVAGEDFYKTTKKTSAPVVANDAVGQNPGQPVKIEPECTTDVPCSVGNILKGTRNCDKQAGKWKNTCAAEECRPGFYLNNYRCLTCPADSDCAGGTAQPVPKGGRCDYDGQKIDNGTSVDCKSKLTDGTGVKTAEDTCKDGAMTGCVIKACDDTHELNKNNGKCEPKPANGRASASVSTPAIGTQESCEQWIDKATQECRQENGIWIVYDKASGKPLSELGGGARGVAEQKSEEPPQAAEGYIVYSYTQDQTYYGQEVFKGSEDWLAEARSVTGKNDLEIHGMCASNAGVENKKGTPNPANGKYCWCRVQSGGKTGAWVFDWSDDSPADCAQGCANGCAIGVAFGSDFRSAVLAALEP